MKDGHTERMLLLRYALQREARAWMPRGSWRGVAREMERAAMDVLSQRYVGKPDRVRPKPLSQLPQKSSAPETREEPPDASPAAEL